MLHRQMMRLILFVCTAALGVAQSAHAVTPDGIPPPEYPAIDNAGVELMGLTPNLNILDVSIGSAKSPLSHGVIFSSASDRDSYLGGMRTSSLSNNYCVSKYSTVPYTVVGNLKQSDIFCNVGSQFISAAEKGATLVDNGNQTLTYTSSQGTKWTIDKAIKSGAWQYAVTRIQEPNGLILDISYKSVTVFWSQIGANLTFSRIQSVTRNDGLQIKYTYAQSTPPTDATTLSSWSTPTTIVAVNNTVDYCDPLGDGCTFSRSWPTATQSYTQATLSYEHAITDQTGGITKYKYSDGVVGIQFPASAVTDTRTYTYCVQCTGDQLRTAKIEGKVWTYQRQAIPYSQGDNITGASISTGTSGWWVYTRSHSFGPKVYIQTEDGSRYNFDTSKVTNNLISVARPEGNSTNYSYDGRSNIVSVSRSPKTGSSLPAVTISSAGYDATCTNLVTCNKPNWVKDALGNQTDYTYDPVHGGVLTETQPAVNGVRPLSRYTYTQRSAWYKNASGTYVKSSDPIWMLTQERFCKTGAASGTGCALAGDEVVTTYDYGPDSGPNNLFLRGISVTADGQTHRSCYAYDNMGNTISETTPNAALGSCP